MNRNGIYHSSVIRPIAELLVPTNKSHFRLHDDPDSGKSNDYIMNGEKIAIYDDELVFKNSGRILSWRGDVLIMINDYKFNTTDSPDAKLIIDFMDEIHFDKHARGKSVRDKNLIKKYFNKRAILASGLKRSETTIFLPENPNEL